MEAESDTGLGAIEKRKINNELNEKARCREEIVRNISEGKTNLKNKGEAQPQSFVEKEDLLL